jgi:hypothetical protein
LLAPQAASAATQSATFNPVLIVDDASSSTGFTFSGFIGPVSGMTTTINLTKCDDPINSSTEAHVGVLPLVLTKKSSCSFKAQPAPSLSWFPPVLSMGRALGTR